MGRSNQNSGRPLGVRDASIVPAPVGPRCELDAGGPTGPSDRPYWSVLRPFSRRRDRAHGLLRVYALQGERTSECNAGETF
jgi:hypothetical protein